MAGQHTKRKKKRERHSRNWCKVDRAASEEIEKEEGRQ